MDIYTIIQKFQAPLKTERETNFIQKFPFFYGWVIFAVGTLGQIMISPGLTFAVSQFIDYFIRDLQINRSMVSTLYTIATIIGSLSLLFMGRMVDRFGPRVMGALIGLFFGLSCIYMGLVLNAAMLFFGFFALRMLGQSSLGLVCNTAINLWWVRRRGTILGLSGLIIGIGSLGIFPNLIQALIAYKDWRFAYLILGGIILVFFVPAAAIFFRNRPEDYGLQPDGIVPIPSGESTIQVSIPIEENWTLGEAMRTPIFWIIAICTATISLVISGLFFHLVSIFEDQQLPAIVAASTFLPVALASAIFNLVSGILVDRISVNYLLAVSQASLIACMLFAQNLSGIPMAYLLGTMIGICLGLSNTVSTVSWAKYYGREHLGAITGASAIIMIIGSALGPMPLGIARDLLGSYDQALTWAISLPLFLLAASLFARPPVKSS